MLKRIVVIIATFSAVALTPFALTGCNTVAGAGTDIERGGEAVHDSARDVQKKL